MFYNLFDSHTHSHNSSDGEHAVTFMAETAINKGLQGFAVTDHCEGSDFAQWGYATRIMQSAISTAKTKEAFGNRIVVSFGIEIADVYYNPGAIEDVLRRHRFDFVIGSVHRLLYEDFDFNRFTDYSLLSEEKLHEYVEKYYEETIDLIKWGNFDVLGHLTLPIRYPKLYNDIDVDLNRHKEQIDEVLRLAAGNGKGIEINTSGLRSAVGDTLPPMWALKRFRELGGEIVTIGSDAHRASDMGRGLDHAMQMLLDAGFEYFAFFRDRKPVMLKVL